VGGRGTFTDKQRAYLRNHSDMDPSPLRMIVSSQGSVFSTPEDMVGAYKVFVLFPRLLHPATGLSSYAKALQDGSLA
jgi:hypothetical protein